MIAQRPDGTGRSCERRRRLPFPDGVRRATPAHRPLAPSPPDWPSAGSRPGRWWSSPTSGLRVHGRQWLVTDYFPEISSSTSTCPLAASWPTPRRGHRRGRARPARLHRRVHASLVAPARGLPRPGVRAAISGLARLPDDVVAAGVERLRTTSPPERCRAHADLLGQDRDAGYRLVVTPAAPEPGHPEPSCGCARRAAGLAHTAVADHRHRAPAAAPQHRSTAHRSTARSRRPGRERGPARRRARLCSGRTETVHTPGMDTTTTTPPRRGHDVATPQPRRYRRRSADRGGRARDPSSAGSCDERSATHRSANASRALGTSS
jgi:hypothetical protein